MKLCVPGTTTTSRPGASGGMPNGSHSPWITSTGTSTPSSSSSRVFSGFPGGWTGNARQSTATASAAAAVRQATRAPEERPPATSGSPASSSPRRCSTTASQAVSSWCAGAGERRPATTVGLLDERDA